jgi:hypothetical protein
MSDGGPVNTAVRRHHSLQRSLKNTMNRLVLLAILLLSITRCGTQPEQTKSANSPPPDQFSVQAEEYEVYSAILGESDKSPADGKPIKLIVIEDSTLTSSEEECHLEKTFESGERKITPELKTLFEDYRAKNKKAEKLDRSFNLQKKYILVDKKDVAALFEKREEDGWAKFYKKYPGSPGTIAFSRVGFNQDKSKAIVYKVNACGWLCAAGRYILLSKTIDAWKVTDVVGCWES